MKLSISTSAAVLLLASTEISAKYISEGWKPGQPTKKIARGVGGHALPTAGFKLHDLSEQAAAKVEEFAHDPPTPYRRPGLIESLSNSVQSATGINLTAVYAATQSSKQYSWDNDTIEGFTRLTDANYEEEVGYERFSGLDWGGGGALGVAKEEKERVWVIQIHGPPRDPASQIFYDAFTNASLTTLAAHDLPHVKFARLDFMTETVTCARWLIFKPPAIVFATNRGAELRFIGPRHIAPNGTIIREFIKRDIWRNMAPWQSEWAPGGNKAWIVNSYLAVNHYWTLLTAKFPTWLILIFSGLATQSLLGCLHKGDGAKREREKERIAERREKEEAEKLIKKGKLEAVEGKKEEVKGKGKKVVEKGKGKDEVTVTVESKKVK